MSYLVTKNFLRNSRDIPLISKTSSKITLQLSLGADAVRLVVISVS